MKLFCYPVAALLLSLSSLAAIAQTELVFKNPVLISGTDKRTGAIYRFQNVRSGTDALLTIAAASETGQLVNNIDVTEHGWGKAFQPEIGKSASVAANQQWWVRFNLKFVHAGTTTKRKIDKFYATTIDLDGDNSVTQEFFQIYKADSMQCSSPSDLVSKTPLAAGLTTDSKTSFMQGPVKNYLNIDTAATRTMVTYTFLSTDELNFVYGAKVGNAVTNAGLRLNSLWFKAFDLKVNLTLPVRAKSFLATADNRHVSLQWSVTTTADLSAFELERSSDGIHFQPVQKINAVEGRTDYQYTDISASSVAGQLYYRLLYIETNGENSYSAVKLIRFANRPEQAITVSPNPVRNNANITLPASWQNQAVTLTVVNSAGIQVQAKAIQQASQTEGLSFGNYPRGIYVVKAHCNGQWLEQKVLRD